jgi:hypothetical protein
MVPELRPTHVYNEAVDVSRDEQEFTRLLVKLKRRRYDDFEFRIVEEDAAGVFMTVTDINVGADPKVFKVAMADAAILAANTPVRKDNDTVSLITAVTQGDPKTTITLADDIGLAVGDVLAIGARAFEENSSAPDPVTFNPTTRVGYQQTIRIAWGESRWVAAVKSFLKETRTASNRRQAMRMARQLVEAGLIHNPMTKVASPLRYYTGGLYDQNVINIFDIEGDGSFTYEMLEDGLTAMKKSSKALIGMCGTKIASEIRKIVWQKNQNAVVEGDYMGVPVTHIRCGSKKVTLLESANLDEGEFQYDLHVLDEKLIGIVTTQDQASGKANWFLLDTNAATPGQDGSLNVLTIDFGFEMVGREKQALFRNLKKGVKS